MAPGDLSLAASLVYIVLRREEMWRHIVGGFLRSEDTALSDALRYFYFGGERV